MATVLLKLFQECQFVRQVNTLGRTVQRAITYLTLWIDDECCRSGNAVMLQRVSEVEQVNHLSVFVTEKGE